MEISGFLRKIIFSIWGGTLFVLPFFTFGYDDSTTHPALTQEIVKFFNASFPEKHISSADAEKIIQGSIDEDAETRWLYHFYDPVYNRGLTLEDNAFPKDPNLALVASGAKSEWASSKVWGTNSELQSGVLDSLTAGVFTEYFSGDEDYSWERAIYEYAWEDRSRGLSALGHVLHLIEDASVPDHTRNDPHPPVLDLGSPYESWTAKFNRQAISVSTSGERPIFLSNIEDYFDSLAKYSNNNFFSKDTIFSTEYIQPTIDFYKTEILNNGLSVAFGYNNSETYRLVRREPKFGWYSITNDDEGGLLLTDDDDKILTDYWTLLSKQAVLHGAGVMKLFFDEVEKEKQTKILYSKNRSWIGKTYDAASNTVSGWWDSATGAVLNIYTNTTNSISGIWNDYGSPSTGSGTNIFSSGTIYDDNLAGVISGLGANENSFEVEPPAGGSTSTDFSDTLGQASSITTDLGSPSIESGTIIYGSPSIGSGTIIGNTGINYLPQPQVAGASTEGSPSIESGTIIYNSGTNISSDTSSFVPIAGGGGVPPPPVVSEVEPQSPPEPESPPPDTEPPDVSLAIQECAGSLAPDACLLASTTITLEWSSGAEDLSHYEITCDQGSPSTGLGNNDGDPETDCPDFTNGTTTATSTIYNAPDLPALYTFSAKAVDTTENESTPAIQSVEINMRPLVVNEIAWMGTSSDQPNDEWIEIKNLTSHPISLDGWILRSKTDNTPYIKLSGEIAANGYAVLERTDETTISNQTAHQVYTGSLLNSVEALELSRASSTVDETPAAEACGGVWCGGAAGGQYYSMERHDPEDNGADPANWGTWQGFLQNGLNADGLKINGTPGNRNTVNYLVARSGTSLQSDKTLKKANSPYIIPHNSVIQPDVTLTIEPGAVIKFLSGGSVLAEGKILVQGSAEDPVIFTSFKDDKYAGDTNQDGSTSSPQARDWSSIKLHGAGSTFNHAILRFGGIPDFLGESWAMIRANDTDISVKNSIFEHSGAYGMWLTNTSGTIESNIMRDNNDGGHAHGVGFVATDGNLEIRGNVFENNGMGLRLTSSGAEHSLKITENIFRGNESFAAQSIGAYPEFSGNSAVENGANGINIQGTVQRDFTLHKDLLYIIQNTTYTIESNKTLTINPGTIIKFQGSGGMHVRGVLNAAGTDSEKIIFTSLYDDEYGGDTDGTSTPAAAAGDWAHIAFLDGSAGSRLEHVIIQYGGVKSTITPENGAIFADNSIFELSNTVINNNFWAGIFLKSTSSVIIKNSVIQNHQEPNTPSPSEPSYGIFLENSSAALENVLFRANKIGLMALASSTISATSVTFEENDTDTIPADLIP